MTINPIYILNHTMIYKRSIDRIFMKITRKTTITLFSLILLLSLLTTVQAAGVPTKYCLTPGQTIELSKCNPQIDDYICEVDTGYCEICVFENSNGNYCPSNSCNSACVPFEAQKRTNFQQLL